VGRAAGMVNTGLKSFTDPDPKRSRCGLVISFVRLIDFGRPRFSAPANHRFDAGPDGGDVNPPKRGLLAESLEPLRLATPRLTGARWFTSASSFTNQI